MSEDGERSRGDQAKIGFKSNPHLKVIYTKIILVLIYARLKVGKKASLRVSSFLRKEPN